MRACLVGAAVCGGLCAVAGALLLFLLGRASGPADRDAELDGMALGRCGQYRLSPKELALGVYGQPAGGPEAPGPRAGVPWEKPRLHLSPDHTFRLAGFPAEWLPALAGAGERVLACEGRWRAASDDGSLVASLVVTAVNGRPADGPLIFRFGSTALLLSPPNDKIAAFVPAP